MLFVQRYADGGSVVSLLDLVRALDPERYRPLVAFRSPSSWVTEFVAAGVDTVVFPSLDPVGPDPGGAAAQPGLSAPPIDRSGRSSLRRELRRFVRRDLPATRWLVGLIRRHHVRIVHANNDVLSNRDALLAGRVARRPVVQHVRGLHEYRPDLARRIDRTLARIPVRFVYISRAAQDNDAVQLGVRADRSLVLDNPFDVGAYEAPRDPALAAELGIPAGAEVVLDLGRLARWKGQDVFLRAMAEVIRSRPTAVALLVGAPLGRRGHAFAEELESLAAELGIAESVVFAGERRDVARVLALADVFVHSATQPEPFGRVVVEAMAAGLPVVASDDGGVREIVDSGRTGRLVEPGRPELLAEVIGELLDDPEAARGLGERGRSEARARFGVAAHARAVQALYDEI